MRDIRKAGVATEFVTLKFKPTFDSFFPDLDAVFIVNGKEWKDYSGSFDGSEWRITFNNIPINSDIEIRRNNGLKIDSQRVVDNDNQQGYA